MKGVTDIEFRFTDFEIFVLLKMGQEILNCMIEGSEG